MLSTTMATPENKSSNARSERVSLDASRAVLSSVFSRRWSLLVLCEACRGTTRFNELKERLVIPPATLAQCLNDLVDIGLLTRRAYSKMPPRWEYVLTAEGERIRPAIVCLAVWSEHHAVAREYVGELRK